MRPRDDPRVGDLLGRRLGPGGTPVAALIGFPADEGVRRNGGRPGAAAAPRAVRDALLRLTPGADPLRDLIERTLDAGDVAVGDDLDAAQQRLGAAVAEWLGRGTIPIVIGGGHETAFGHFLGYVAAELDVAILNVDAHPDVRPLVGGRGHSGSPFRQALLHEAGRCREYRVAGLQPHAAAAAHVRFIAERGGRCYWRSEVTPAAVAAILGELPAPVMVSFDIDAVDASQAPGVSAPATDGLTAELWLEAARLAGRSPRTRSMDLVEVNPAFDVDGRTVRLAAATIWRFLEGLATRDHEP